MRKTKLQMLEETSKKLNLFSKLESLKLSIPSIEKLESLTPQIMPNNELERLNQPLVYNNLYQKNDFFLITERISEFLKDCENQENELKEYPIYNETVYELERTKIELENVIKELEGLKKDFRKFYERTAPKQQPNQEPKQIQLESTLSSYELKTLYDSFGVDLFDCDFEDFKSLFSSEMTTKINVKKGITKISVVEFFSVLKEKKRINNRWADSITKTESIIFENLPLTSEQIKTAKKGIKQKFDNSYIINEIDSFLQ